MIILYYRDDTLKEILIVGILEKQEDSTPKNYKKN